MFMFYLRRVAKTFILNFDNNALIISRTALTHSSQGFLMFSGGREKVHWERMG